MGTFAEIGAGQEVARHFFMAGHASQTVAKTMSAYSMEFSDEIYGKEKKVRYVSKERLLQMFEHEYHLLEKRLTPKKDSEALFFVFASTLTTNHSTKKSHGWMGVRFQKQVHGPTHDIILHVKMKDHERLRQHEALGFLGVNLLYHAFYKSIETLVPSLLDGISSQRLEIDMIHASGEEFKGYDSSMLPLQLVEENCTKALVFSSQTGQATQASDVLFEKPILVERGDFRPITNTDQTLIKKGLHQIQSEKKFDQKPTVLLEVPFSHLFKSQEQKQLDKEECLFWVQLLLDLGHNVLISQFKDFSELKTYIREHSKNELCILMSAKHLEDFFNENNYTSFEGGILEGFARLFDQKTTLMIYPYKTEKICLTTKSFFPEKHLSHFYNHLTSEGRIKDLLDCDDIEIFVNSSEVRKAITSGDSSWEQLVPTQVFKKINTSNFLKKS